MRIALYYPWIYVKGGVGRTILEIKKRSRHEWTIFTSHFNRETSYPEFNDFEVIELKRVPVRRTYFAVLKAGITIFFQKIDLKNFDYLWVHSEGLGDFITFRNHQKPIVCFCHTPLKIIHDPFLRKIYIKNNPLKLPLFILACGFFRFIDRFAWRNYAYIFCGSKEVRERIIKAKLAPAEKIEVIYRGIDLDKICPTWVFEPYFFHLARIKWWKNIELSIEAFDFFQRKNPQFYNFKLIIAGQVNEENKNYYQRLLNLAKRNQSINIIPNPNEEQLHNLYRNCYAVLSTTLNEDWGFTVVEAMGYGKPVIAINQGGPKETVIDRRTGLLVEPNIKSYAMAMKILALNKDIVVEMGRQARLESLKYSWDSFVRRIDDFLDNLKG